MEADATGLHCCSQAIGSPNQKNTSLPSHRQTTDASNAEARRDRTYEIQQGADDVLNDTNETIWGVLFHDGDSADYNVPQLQQIICLDMPMDLC